MPERSRQPHAVPAPCEARVARDDVVQQAPRESGRHVPQRKEPPRRLFGVDRAAPLLDEFDEPIRGVDPQLHGRDGSEHMFDRQGTGSSGRGVQRSCESSRRRSSWLRSSSSATHDLPRAPTRLRRPSAPAGRRAASGSMSRTA